MEIISPKRIALMAIQVSVLLGVCIGLTTLLLPLTNFVAITCLSVCVLISYALFVGYLGLSSLYLLLHYRQMTQRQVVLSAAAIGVFTFFWAGIFGSGFNTTVYETRSILSTFKTDKGLFSRLAVANLVRDTYKRSLTRKMARDICKSEEDYLGHLPIVKDEGVSIERLARQLEAGYKNTTCF